MCPEGQQCVNGRCQVDANASRDMSQGGGETDGADSNTGNPCRQPGGFVVGRRSDHDIYACPGKFDSRQAGQQCQMGYSLCSTSDGIDADRCGKDGFFISRRQGRWDNNGQKAVCTDNFTLDLYLMGCGALPKGVVKADCDGFAAALKCAEDDTFTCNGGPSAASNSKPSNGVLCCPPG